MIKVTYIYREFRQTGFSIEGIFDAVRYCLKGRVDDSVYHCDPEKSRLSNIFAIRKLPTGISHLTGDVHFLFMGLRGKKNILTIHDLAHYEHLRRSPLKFLVYHYFWFYFPLKKANVITVVSESTREHLIRTFKFAKDKVRVVYNPVKPIFGFCRKEKLNTPPRILQIGTGDHKNLNNLIEAVKGTDYHLDIVALPDEKCIEKMRRYNVQFSIANGLSDEQLYQKYIDCDIVFFASFQEGFGMPIIEAQAVGRPVITSNLGAMLEVAKDTAVLVDPHNVSEIRAAINDLVNDRAYYDSAVEKGRCNAAKYSAEYVAGEYLKIYKELGQL
jgi:glycosyltransferase involved in cell wall biosynthesis